MTIQEAIWEIVKDKVVVSCFSATVESVDEDNDSCTLQSIEDEDLQWFDVRLNSTLKTKETKIVNYPKIGSTVLYIPVDGQKSQVYLMAMSEIDKSVIKVGTLEIVADAITMNGDDNGGIAIAPEIETQFKKNSAAIDKILDAINNAVPIAQDGGIGLQTTMKAIIAGAITGDMSNIESKTIQHG